MKVLDYRYSFKEVHGTVQGRCWSATLGGSTGRLWACCAPRASRASGSRTGCTPASRRAAWSPSSTRYSFSSRPSLGGSAPYTPWSAILGPAIPSCARCSELFHFMVVESEKDRRTSNFGRSDLRCTDAGRSASGLKNAIMHFGVLLDIAFSVFLLFVSSLSLRWAHAPAASLFSLYRSFLESRVT